MTTEQTNALDASEIFEVKLTAEQLYIIEQLLQQAPYKIAQPVLDSMQSQIRPQGQAKIAAAQGRAADAELAKQQSQGKAKTLVRKK